MDAHLVQAGSVLADRYVVEDHVAAVGDSDTWRARDSVLARSVVLQILPSSSPRAAGMLLGAKRASRVNDPRILQVLDAVDDGNIAYVVREWTAGQSLEVLLGEGPLPSRRATWLAREVAAAMASAHRTGLAHGRLCPDNVIVTKSSGIKVVGLGTYTSPVESGTGSTGAEGGEVAADEHTLSLAAVPTSAGGTDVSSHAASDPVLDETALSVLPSEVESALREDVRSVGRLLYACLTARWPGEPAAGLPPAPTEHGRVLRPRQVRAGVPRALDAICDRVLAEPSRYGAPITSMEELKEELVAILSEDGAAGSAVTGLAAPSNPASPVTEDPPALLTRPVGATAAEDVAAYADSAPRRRSRLGRAFTYAAVTALVLGAMLLAYLVGQRGGPATAGNDQITESPTATNLQPLPVRDVASFDPPPFGSGDENPDSARLAIDGNPDTAWETVTYYGTPALGGQKEGVGLVVDLGHAQQVSVVDVVLGAPGTSLEVRAAPPGAVTPPATSAGDYALVSSRRDVGNTARIKLDRRVRTQFLLVWLTSLPAETAGSYKGRIAEIKVLG